MCQIFIFFLICLTACTQNLKENYNQAQIHFRLGESYLREAKYTLALKELLQAAKLNPRDPDIHLALGLGYMGRGDYKTAEKEFKKVLNLNKNYAAAYNNLGFLYLQKRDFAKAETYFKKALNIASYPTPEAAYTNLGSCYLLQKRYQEARKNFTLALEVNPSYLPAYFGLARTWEEKGMYRRAILVYIQAINQLPEEPTLYYRTGLLYLKIGETEKAKKMLEKVIKLGTDPLREKAINLLDNLQ